MASGFRFDPPRVELSDELEWVLRRAFGPAAWRAGSALQPESVLEVAASLDLAARVASRTPRDVLTAEVGAAAAGHLRDSAAEAAAQMLGVDQACREIVRECAALDAAPVFLKGTALVLSDVSAAGARTMSDVDVLVPAAKARALQSRLLAGGWTEIAGPSAEHQLPVIAHRLGVAAEVHLMVRGVRLGGGRASAGAEALAAGGLTRELGGFEEPAFILCPELLLAHLLVHGIAQHGLLPSSYPMLRMLADAQDLLPDRAAWDRELPAAMRWIEGDVGVEEAAAVRDLALRLAAGESPRTIAGGADRCALMLRHLVAGALDPEYDEALRLRSRLAPLAAGGGARTLLRSAFRTVWLTRPQVDVLYGRPRSALGYWGWRLWRPFDLVGRTWQYGRAWLRHRGRRR